MGNRAGMGDEIDNCAIETKNICYWSTLGLQALAWGIKVANHAMRFDTHLPECAPMSQSSDFVPVVVVVIAWYRATDSLSSTSQVLGTLACGKPILIAHAHTNTSTSHQVRNRGCVQALQVACVSRNACQNSPLHAV
jgi:hypothetical protein